MTAIRAEPRQQCAHLLQQQGPNCPNSLVERHAARRCVRVLGGLARQLLLQLCHLVCTDLMRLDVHR